MAPHMCFSGVAWKVCRCGDGQQWLDTFYREAAALGEDSEGKNALLCNGAAETPEAICGLSTFL